MKTIAEIKELIERIPYLNISTVNPDGKPWLSPCWSAYDENYVFYWSSSPKSQHSENIRRTPDIFLAIYDSSVTKDGWALYAQAEAYELTDVEEIKKVIDIFYKRKNRVPKSMDYFTGSGPQRLYKALVKKAWINDYDANRDPADFKLEVKLV